MQARDLSLFTINGKGQLCIPDHDGGPVMLLFNAVMEKDGNYILDFLKNIFPLVKIGKHTGVIHATINRDSFEIHR